MVKYNDAALNRIFAALSDPTRRGMLARLSANDTMSVSELAQPFAMSLPAAMKHLDVLADAGLVERRKTGRTVACLLNAGPMQEANAWLNRYQKFWAEGLDRLAAFLEDESWQRQPSRASRSSVASKRVRPKPSARGPNRRT